MAIQPRVFSFSPIETELIDFSRVKRARVGNTHANRTDSKASD